MYGRTPKLRITQTLLSSWQGIFKYEDGYEDFLRTLNREKKQPTPQMLDGIRYENCLNSVLNGERIDPDHEWFVPIKVMAEELEGAQQQVNLFADTDIVVDGYQILLHGVLDYLRAGIIYDCKFSKRYHLNKYLDSPQTALYLALVPEAREFEYIISDGKWVYREKYPRDIVPPIEPTIKNFIEFCDKQNLRKTLEEKWAVGNA